MSAPLNASLIEKGEFVSDNLSRIQDILQFLEETAGNYASYPTACEHGYSVDGWAGFNLALALARENLAALRENPALKNIVTE